MAIPNGYDIGLQHASVNGGVAVGLLLDEERHEDAFVEDQALVAHVDVTVAGTTSVASYGFGPRTYHARVLLRGDILKRDHRPGTETPTTLRTLLLAFASTATAVTLQLPTGDRSVVLTDAIRFISGPSVDGYVALLVMTDVGVL